MATIILCDFCSEKIPDDPGTGRFAVNIVGVATKNSFYPDQDYDRDIKTTLPGPHGGKRKDIDTEDVCERCVKSVLRHIDSLAVKENAG